MHNLRLLGYFRLAILIACVTFVPCRDVSAGDAPVELPAFYVNGRFSELLCAARFRYHLPGAKLKELVVRRMPKSWATAGVKVGDSVVKIDNLELNGISLPDLGRHLKTTFKTDPAICTFEVHSMDSKKTIRLEAKFEKDQDEFTIAYP
jgi:hypothetical protein